MTTPAPAGAGDRPTGLDTPPAIRFWIGPGDPTSWAAPCQGASRLLADVLAAMPALAPAAPDSAGLPLLTVWIEEQTLTALDGPFAPKRATASSATAIPGDRR